MRDGPGPVLEDRTNPSNEFTSESPVLPLTQFGFAFLLNAALLFCLLLTLYLLPAFRTEVV